MKTLLRPVLALLAFVLLAAPAAQAGETLLTPYAGITFGANPSLVEDNKEHGVYGGSLAFLSDGGFGLEIDFAYSPDFFGGSDTAVPDNNLTSLMANLMMSGHVGDNSRIYASAGGGLLKSRVNDVNDFFDVDRNDFGANVGAGVILGFGEKVGVRGDIRYFRNVGDPEPDDEFDIDFGSFRFWRATGGLTIRF